MRSSGFGPSALVRLALVCATFSPALVMIALRGLWPQTWVRVAVVVVAAAAVVATAAFFRIAVPRRNAVPTRLRSVQPRLSVNGLLGLFVIPCLVALASPPDAKWAAAAALVLLGVLADRTDAALTDNPMLTLLGLYTFDAVCEDDNTVIVVSRKRSPHPGEVVALAYIGLGVYAADTLRPSEPEPTRSTDT